LGTSTGTGTGTDTDTGTDTGGIDTDGVRLDVVPVAQARGWPCSHYAMRMLFTWQHPQWARIARPA
jgi:hypothetical protein